MTTCARCKRPLSDPLSVEAGMGPICRAHGYVESDIAKQEGFADVFEDAIPFRKALVMKRTPNHDPALVGGVITNVPHLVMHHSPNGYEFGYAGSGPADLALNVCQLYLNIIGYEGRKLKLKDGVCWTLAWMMHQDFKDVFIANVPPSGATVPFGKMEAWFNMRMSTTLLMECSDDDHIYDGE